MPKNRVSVGIEGLDEMLGGGIPQSHTVVVMGSFGTGKTTFGLQFIHKGLLEGEKCAYITLEEDVESIKKTAEAFGWHLEPYIERQQLGVFRLEPENAKSSIAKVRSELPHFFKTFGMKRVVIDSISLLSMLYPTDSEKRNAVFTLSRQIKSTGATTILTAEVNETNPNVSRDGFVEYIADGVILLKYLETKSGNVKLILRIVKMRQIAHEREVKPYEITSNGLMVYSKAVLLE